jgi:pyruvate,orthophosphate dikinase
MSTSEFYAVRNSADFADAFDDLFNYVDSLDNTFDCAVDVEFTIEDGKLWILQCRTAKLGAKARALQLLCQYIPDADAAYVLGELQDILGSQSAAPASTTAKLAFTGQGVSSGIATGFLALTAEAVAEYKSRGESYIFAAQDTSPDDTAQMLGAAGLLTANGSSTCHAAVCARAWDTPAVVGAGFTMVGPGDGAPVGITHDGSLVISSGDLVTINGDTGEVSIG